MRTRSIHKAALTDAVTPLEEAGKKLFVNEWSIRMTIDRNDGLKLTEFGRS